MKIQVFANPKSGRGRGRQIAESLHAKLRHAGYDSGTCLEHPQALSQFPAADALIVAGGDGTLRTVLDHARRQQLPPPPTLFIPVGTANLMARHLEMDWSLKYFSDQALERIQRWNIQPLDAAECNGQLFLLMTTVGFDASIVHQLARRRRGPIRLASYISPTIDALLRYRQPNVKVTVDGEVLVSNQPRFVYVGNVREYGAGFPIASHARSDDGLLDVCLFPAAGYLNLLQLSLLSTVQMQMELGESIFRRGREIRIETDAPVPVQIDGDPGGFSPVDIRLLPWTVPFIVD